MTIKQRTPRRRAPRAPRAARRAPNKAPRGKTAGRPTRRWHYEELMVQHFSKIVGRPMGQRKMVVDLAALGTATVCPRTGHIKRKQLIEWDFYFPPTATEPGIVGECQGIGHYRPVAAWGGVRGFIGQVRRDHIKRLVARRAGLFLIEIANTDARDPQRVCGEPEFRRRLANATRAYEAHRIFWQARRAEQCKARRTFADDLQALAVSVRDDEAGDASDGDDYEPPQKRSRDDDDGDTRPLKRAALLPADDESSDDVQLIGRAPRTAGSALDE